LKVKVPCLAPTLDFESAAAGLARRFLAPNWLRDDGEELEADLADRLSKQRPGFIAPLK
jgi:hypothetical protein